MFVNVGRRRLKPSRCRVEDSYVNYLFEYDLHHQVFNSSFQDLQSTLVQNCQADLVSLTAEEVYQRNMASDLTDNVRIMNILDVTKQYDGLATVRYYLSIVIRRSQIPVVRHVLSSVFKRLQTERFTPDKANIHWEKMVLIH